MAAGTTRSPRRLALGAVGALLLAWGLVPVLQAVLHGSLPLWLHIPVAALLLGTMAAGALAAGVLWAEYRLSRGQRI
ncbi:MAG: hypothetical protein L6E13_08610 [Firmicutes bacterium]|nr:hypothetical protein [Bacillota bacterium]